ncbi:ABC transporter transmembrane region [Bacteriovorax sp. BAL6_X]|uniref:ABC transporter transmembrane domain-containing protein n=1 Tax=Bacteriovorax sp. BAL6_X TaxID=1201290 RepID=UPI0003867322|nr:ABC transporter transmembrane domain-containing protein [Bacteriovorax sp. BAL6_X]EPZ51113.1 ABC transporter transmembrane region [Bacteriovorax sp. BAL6_X]
MEIKSTSSIDHTPSTTLKWISENSKIFSNDLISLRVLLTLTLVISITSLALPTVLMQLFDRIIPGHNTGSAIVLIFGLTLFILFESALKYLRYYFVTFASARFENKKSQELIKKIITDTDFYDVGVFQYSLKEIQRNKDFFTGKGFVSLLELPFISLYFGFLFYLNPLMAFIPFLAFSIYMIVSFYTVSKMTRIIQLKHITDIEQNNLLYKILDNLTLLRKFGRINLFNNRFKKNQAAVTKNNFLLARYAFFQFNLNQLILQLTSVTILATGAYLVINGLMSIGSLAASLILANRCIAPTEKFFKVLRKIHEVKVMTDTLVYPRGKSQEKEKENIDKIYSMVIPIYIRGRKHEIPFMKGDTVSLKDQDKDTKEFLFAPNLKSIANKVYIDNLKLSDIDELSLYKNIAIINARPNIWNGTIRDNITSFGFVSEKKAQSYIDTLGLGEIIKKLPNGLDTKLTSEKEDNISDEVKSLIYITRQLSLDPEVIILNEFEAGVDRESYIYIFNYIASIRESRIIFVNTKDRNLLKLCNRDLLNNRIGEIDTYLA